MVLTGNGIVNPASTASAREEGYTQYTAAERSSTMDLKIATEKFESDRGQMRHNSTRFKTDDARRDFLVLKLKAVASAVSFSKE